jgi:hypothetical protein
MPYFTPPTRNDVVYLDEYGTNIFNHLAPTSRGVNVFITTDGVVTENQPASWSSVSTVYYGGHRTLISESEATILTGAGYGDYIEA